MQADWPLAVDADAVHAAQKSRWCAGLVQKSAFEFLALTGAYEGQPYGVRGQRMGERDRAGQERVRAVEKDQARLAEAGKAHGPAGQLVSARAAVAALAPIHIGFKLGSTSWKTVT